MNKRVLIAGILGGIAMYVWTSIAHVALPLGAVGIREIPGEQALLGAMQGTLGDTRGLYLFPAMGSGGMDGYAQKLAGSPSGLLMYTPPGAKPITPAQLITEFLTELIATLLAVSVVVRTRVRTFGSRVGLMVLIGLIAALATNVSYWNWYGFPAAYTISYMSIQIVGYVAAGLVAAWWLGRGEGAEVASTARA